MATLPTVLRDAQDLAASAEQSLIDTMIEVAEGLFIIEDPTKSTGDEDPGRVLLRMSKTPNRIDKTQYHLCIMSFLISSSYH